MNRAIAQSIACFPLSIPLRRSVEHAAASRETADPIVVSIELRDGTTGWGETLPRTYVTGEDRSSVLEAIERVCVPLMAGFHPNTFVEALEFADALPWSDTRGRSMPAARAGVELALLDASMRHFHRDADSIVQWLGLPGFGSPGSLRQIRFSGVVASASASSCARQVRFMRWGGLRDFKIKVGFPDDRARLDAVFRRLSRGVRAKRLSVRADANGAWSKDRAIEWLHDMSELPLSAIEQPLPRGSEEDLVTLCDLFAVPLIHDESLITLEDGHRLIDLGVAGGFNIRLSKNGGLIPSLRLASLARRHGVAVQLGCMVGETSLLAAAGLRFLGVCPGVVHAEGCFGRWLLADDVARPRLTFRYGGRPPSVTSEGWGVSVDGGKLARWSGGAHQNFRL